MLCDESFSAPHIAIRDLADDLHRVMGGQVDLHDGTASCHVHVRWRVIEGLDADFESGLPEEGGHIVMLPKALG